MDGQTWKMLPYYVLVFAKNVLRFVNDINILNSKPVLSFAENAHHALFIWLLHKIINELNINAPTYRLNY
jgi:hypothetical protein